MTTSVDATDAKAPLSRWRREWRMKRQAGENACWKIEIAEKFARWINKHCFTNQAKVNVFGPMGIASRVDIEFKLGRKVYRITLEPNLHERGSVFRQTLWGKKRKGGIQFRPGTIGYINSLDTATDQLSVAPTRCEMLTRLKVRKQRL